MLPFRFCDLGLFVLLGRSLFAERLQARCLAILGKSNAGMPFSVGGLHGCWFSKRKTHET